jgi:hypothetical protein
MGTAMPGFEYRFKITTCVWCQQEMDFTVHLKPPTAGVRILSIDGGGARGVIPLETIRLLQIVLGDLPVREMFDLAVGTSSGKCAIPRLGIFLTVY